MSIDRNNLVILWSKNLTKYFIKENIEVPGNRRMKNQ